MNVLNLSNIITIIFKENERLLPKLERSFVNQYHFKVVFDLAQMINNNKIDLLKLNDYLAFTIQKVKNVNILRVLKQIQFQVNQ